jgi:hypothetical protein
MHLIVAKMCRNLTILKYSKASIVRFKRLHSYTVIDGPCSGSTRKIFWTVDL